APAGGGEGGAGVVQYGAAADEQLPAVRVGGGQVAFVVTEQAQLARGELPPPRLGVVDRRRARGAAEHGRDGGLVGGLHLCALSGHRPSVVLPRWSEQGKSTNSPTSSATGRPGSRWPTALADPPVQGWGGMRTGQCARWSMACAVEPGGRPGNPPRPRAPTTSSCAVFDHSRR